MLNCLVEAELRVYVILTVKYHSSYVKALPDNSTEELALTPIYHHSVKERIYLYSLII